MIKMHHHFWDNYFLKVNPIGDRKSLKKII